MKHDDDVGEAVIKMSEMDKYYQILGLNPGASEEEIKQAYKDLINVWHPDRFLNNPRLRQKANEKLKEINGAFEKVKSYVAGNSRYASSEGYSKSQPPPREPPPKWEKEKSSTTENRGYGKSEPPPDEPPLKEDETGALWNPNAATIWSLPFTPAFGSYLQMLNWRTLNEPAKASSSQSWFYASLLMMFIYSLIGMFVSDAEDRYNIIWWLSFLYLITWYIVAGRYQVKYVKAKFGKNYPKKPWGRALLIAVGALIGCWVVLFAIGFIFRFVTTKDYIDTASVAPSSAPTGEVRMPLDPLFENIGKDSRLDPLYKDIDKGGGYPDQPPPETGLSAVDLYNTGYLFQSSGNFRAAIDAYSKAIALNPQLTAAYDNRAFSYYKLGKLQEAIKDLDKVIEARPRDAKAHRIRGNLHFDLGNIPESVKDMKIAAELEPKQPQPQAQSPSPPQVNYQKEAFIPASQYNKRGVEYFSKAEYDKAIENFTTALSMESNPSYSTYFDRGRSYYEIKQYDKAIEDFKQAISLAPNNAKAHGWCGVASYKREFYYEATNYFSKAIELEPNSTVHYLNRGYAYMKIGMQSLAVSDFKKACDLGDEDACRQLKTLGYN